MGEGKLKSVSAAILRKLHCIYRAAFDQRVPWAARFLILATLAYVLSPIDLIPDFIPVLGLLDEVILVPLALKLIFRLIPGPVLAEYEGRQPAPVSNGLLAAGAGLVALFWLLLIGAGAALIN